MSMAILKSPTLIHQRLSLGADRDQATLPSSAMPEVVDPRKAIEAEVRATLEAQYQARFDEAKEEARAEGYKEGLAAGHEDGMASAIDSLKKKQALLEQVIAKAEEQFESWMQSLANDALELAKEAVCQFMGEQALNPSMLQNVIKRVSAGLRESDVLSVRLYPADCQLLRSALKQAGGAQGTSRLTDKLREDSSLDAGGIVIDTPRGEYRATFDVQLKKLMALIDEQRASLTSSSPVYHALRA